MVKLMPFFGSYNITNMTTETFSRAYLQGLPEQYKQQLISHMLLPVVNEIKGRATSGVTSYTYVMPAQRQYMTHAGQPSIPVITEPDMVDAIRLKFPDCTVSYQETWVDTDSRTRTLKKGIVIDWV